MAVSSKQSRIDDLQKSLDGFFIRDDLHKELFSSDASIYRKKPFGVVFPKSVSDVQKIILFANENGLSIIPRGTGTSLAGQCVGEGIVLDTSRFMTEILEVNESEKWIRVQPGIIRDVLNKSIEGTGLFFAPITATSNRATIGGMIGNNSCGSNSIVYGPTRDHILEIKAVLSDGTTAIFNNESLPNAINEGVIVDGISEQFNELKKDKKLKKEIEDNFPDPNLKRRNTGYAIDLMLNDKLGLPNFCDLICGSEGTLCSIVEAKLKLTPVPPVFSNLLVLHFNSISSCLEAVKEVIKFNPFACELIDKKILDCTKDHPEHKNNRFFLQGDPEGILVVEFRNDTEEKLQENISQILKSLEKNKIGYSISVVSNSKAESVWQLRNAGLGLLSNIPGKKKAIACVEDTAVNIDVLPEYIREFTEILNKYNQDCVYYAHAGDGELHLRPILDLGNDDELEIFKKITHESAILVKKYNGSLSGEHGDGRVRSPYIKTIYGSYIVQIFENIKSVWDPSNIFNPNKIVNPLPIDEDLRESYLGDNLGESSFFDYRENGGINRYVSKCNGSGDCRKPSELSGIMCPSYRVTKAEEDSTRGRANVFSMVLNSSDKKKSFGGENIKRVMKNCLSCKACSSECPSEVDMALLKSEYQYQILKNKIFPLRALLVSNFLSFYKWAIPINKIANQIINSKLINGFIKLTLNFDKSRNLPEVPNTSLFNWYKKNYHNESKSNKELTLLCDEFSNTIDSEIGIKTIKLLQKLGYKVHLYDNSQSGRVSFSVGLLDTAKKHALKNIELFSKKIDENNPLVGIEPSAILGFRDEYLKMFKEESDKNKALSISKNTFLIEEFLISEIRKGNIKKSQFTDKKLNLIYHPHCHQSSLSNAMEVYELLSLPENFRVTRAPSGCCGMAGLFGYNKSTYDLSIKIGNLKLMPFIKRNKKNHLIVASGTSCRQQIKDILGIKAHHPVEVLLDALK